MTEHKQYKVKAVKVPKKWKTKAFIDKDAYEKLYQKSVEKPDKFWGKEGKRIDWIKPYTQVKNTSFAYPDVSIKWFEDGTLNVAANCIDRHLTSRGDQVAILWEGDDPKESRAITYRELHAEVSRFANVLKKLGAKKGDRITIYMPMIPEAAFAMLACARIGAIHSVVFGGFSPDSLAGRIDDCGSKLVITADEGLRGGRKVPLKKNTDEALAKSLGDVQVLVIRRTGGEVAMHAGRDVWYHDLAKDVPADCPPVEMSAEDPLFILYTSGSTGEPKGVLHTTGGYLVYAAMTHQLVFDYHDGEVFWCTA
ncbi:MAG: AMP-binding protein, partial [Methyloceanibacter sp.]